MLQRYRSVTAPAKEKTYVFLRFLKYFAAMLRFLKFTAIFLRKIFAMRGNPATFALTLHSL